MAILTVQSWWHTLSGAEQIYWGIALIASALFVVQLLLSFVGVDSDLDIDLEDGDAGIGIFSIKGLISFFMFFGWGGIAALSAGLRTPQVLMVAFLIGFLAMVAVAYVFSKLLGLQESGTVNISGAVGEKAEVYLTIPGDKGGLGKIHLKVGGKVMEFDAVTTGYTLSYGTEVIVTNIDSENVMLVEAAT